jgi:hypothetical protein
MNNCYEDCKHGPHCLKYSTLPVYNELDSGGEEGNYIFF